MGLRRKKFEEEVKNCPQCGAEYQGYPEFCDECGYDFASYEPISETGQKEPLEEAEKEPLEEAENDEISVDEKENEEETAEEATVEDDISADREENEEDNAVDSEEDSADSGEVIELTSWEDLDTEDDGDIAFEDEDIFEEEPEEDTDGEELDTEVGEEPEELTEYDKDADPYYDETDNEEEQTPDERWYEAEYTALEKAVKEEIEVSVEQVDFSEAVEGPSIVAYETEEGYKVITAPNEIMINCLVCDEDTAKILKADFMLRTEDYLSVKDKALLYSLLKENETEAKDILGYDDINEYFGEPADLYADMVNVADELLETDMNFEVMAVLAKTTKEQQKLVAKVVNRYDLNRVTVVSAKQIADGKKTEEEIKEILMQDERMFEILKYTVAK